MWESRVEIKHYSIAYFDCVTVFLKCCSRGWGRGLTASFRGCGFTSGGQDHTFAFSATVQEIQARKYDIESLPIVQKDKEAASLEVKGYCMYSCLLIVHLPSGHLVDIWKPSMRFSVMSPKLPPSWSTIYPYMVSIEDELASQISLI